MTPRIRASLLLLLGFAIRFWASAYARFTGDESHYWYVSRQLATFSQFPVYGPEITGSEAHLPGALYYYLMAIPQLLGASPRFGAVAVIAGHLLSAWLFYRLLYEARGERAALFGLALAMLTPWDVLYSDRIWGSCVVPILGSIALYAAARVRDGAKWQAILVIVDLVLPQLHLSSPVLWAACGAIVLLRPPARWDRRALAIGLGVVLVAYSPMLIAELQSGFHNTKLIFSKAGGKEPWSKSLLVPLEMFGYAVFYGSSELSYHFGRGYWGGYDDAARYLSIDGWQRWFSHEGALAALTIVSMLLALALWIAALIALGRRIKERSLEQVFFLGLLAGLGAGLVLLMPSRKAYFPHYANVLMPMLLWPLALALDSAWKTRWRIPALAALAISMASMVINVARYYRDIDGLNGLVPTMEMVGAALAEEKPIDVSFEHFNNAFAWSLVAKGVYGRDLRLQRGAMLRWQVRNARRHEGDVPPNGRQFGPLLVMRDERVRAKPKGLVYRASEQWRSIEVIGKVACKAGQGSECRYGDRPWQALHPEGIEMHGRVEPVLFLHPIAGTKVVARIQPPKATRGVLYYGLSDAALQSTNQAPVRVLLKQRENLLELATDRTPGLKSAPFTLTSTAPIELEIGADNDGARVFGFDVDLY